MTQETFRQLKKQVFKLITIIQHNGWSNSGGISSSMGRRKRGAKFLLDAILGKLTC